MNECIVVLRCFQWFDMIYFSISIPPWLWWENHWLERQDCFGVFGVNVFFFHVEALVTSSFELMTLPVCFSLEPAWLKRLKLSTSPWWTSGSLGVLFKVNSNQALWIFIIICYGSPPLVNDIIVIFTVICHAGWISHFSLSWKKSTSQVNCPVVPWKL